MPQSRINGPYLDWNTDVILSRAGGTSSAIKELLASEGFDAPPDLTIYQWKARGVIARQWLPMLIWAVLKNQKAKLSELMVRIHPK